MGRPQQLIIDVIVARLPAQILKPPLQLGSDRLRAGLAVEIAAFIGIDLQVVQFELRRPQEKVNQLYRLVLIPRCGLTRS